MNDGLKSTVLIVDDDKFIQKFITKTLASEFTTHCASNAEEALQYAASLNPDIILLDIEMPGMNGYETCDALKQHNSTQDIPVIFLSSKTEIREKMLGYEVGGVDFISKPCEQEELIAKLKVYTGQRTTSRELERKAENASKTALSAMTGNSELGQVIQFMEGIHEISTFQALADHFFQLTNTLSLNSCLLFCTAEGDIFVSSTGVTSAIEKDLIPGLHKVGRRFHDFGTRTQINYPRAALLIKNMPVKNREKYGRIKDLLPAALSAVDAKIKSLDAELALVKQSNNLQVTLNNVNDTLTTLADSMTSNQDEIIQIMKEMLTELEQHLPRMGLEDDQESYLIARIDKAINNSLDVNGRSGEIKSSYKTISRLLHHVSDRQQSLVKLIFTRFEKKPDSTESESESESTDSDIELF
ncbi:MAG: response regulator [Gammaproteobacteria bacterium]|nr:response regulator [Gammaproteobacteria bacterium]